MPERPVITLSLATLLTLILSGLVLVLFWQLRWLLIVLMVAVVIAATLAPAVNTAERWGLPRWLAVIGVYFALLSLAVGFGVIIGPTVAEQIQRLLRKLPAYLEILANVLENLSIRWGLTEPDTWAYLESLFNIQSLTTWGLRTSRDLLVRSYSLTRGLVGGVLSTLLAIILSGYMLTGSESLIRGLVQLFPTPWDSKLAAQVQPVSQRMGGYIQGRILVSAILGVAISLGLNFLGLSEFALGLGVIAGFTNLIPFFGPVLGSIPALIVAIAQGGWLFLWVLLLFVIIQNIETYVLDPLLVGNTVQVPPILQLLAVLGGAQVLGIIGALIVPPWVAGSLVVLDNLYIQPKLKAEDGQTLPPVEESPHPSLPLSS
ncbi:AI-2E family transporter [Spirulina subsalsa FACHB-351]|uniref:AI-2E family transporter n=1 Tax=Spirulina subsalsa FACHB-351 TaxID=234711 RepID=A0ABT3L7K2_9CYAN|nr:AI-2E family transporter [Spirulina subsalsa]MCW6037427.1 AI-2E family transporter [Spirulina subsalsa FACHB-351]